MNPVRAYHAHVYFDSDERSQAALLRTELGRRFAVRVGSLHDSPVGPHPKAMFQVLIAPPDFPAIVAWLTQHRRGLSVLLHPDSGDDLADHRDGATWLGESLPLDLSKLSATAG